MNGSRFPDHVSEKSVRATAAEVFVVTLAALVLRSPWPALLLILDFGARAVLGPRWSVLAVLAKRFFVPLLGSEDRQIPFPPKRFAAAIGLALSALGFVLGLVGVPWGFYAALGVLGLFSALESFAGFCAGCAVFGLLMRWGLVPEHICPQCRIT